MASSTKAKSVKRKQSVTPTSPPYHEKSAAPLSRADQAEDMALEKVTTVMKKRKLKKVPALITAKDRMREFPDEPFEVMFGQPKVIRCMCCNKVISTDITTIKKHVASANHNTNKGGRGRTELHMKSLNNHFAAMGESNTDILAFRCHVLSQFMRLGIALNKLADEGLRGLIEDGRSGVLS